jgi:hypothetical protein
MLVRTTKGLTDADGGGRWRIWGCEKADDVGKLTMCSSNRGSMAALFMKAIIYPKNMNKNLIIFCFPSFLSLLLSVSLRSAAPHTRAPPFPPAAPPAGAAGRPPVDSTREILNSHVRNPLQMAGRFPRFSRTVLRMLRRPRRPGASSSTY